MGIPDVQICLVNGQFPDDGEFQDEQIIPTNYDNTITNEDDSSWLKPLTALLTNTFLINDAEANEGNFEFCVFTDADGGYQITGLAANEYTVFEVLPEGSTNTTPLSQIVTVGDGQIVQNVNFGNKIALPPPDEVTVSPSNFDFGGIPVIYWQSETTYTKDVGPDGFDHCGADMPLAVKLVIGPFSETPGSEPVEMMMSNTSGEIWEANFGPLFPAHGTAPLTFYVDCPPDTTDFPEDISLISGEDEIQKGRQYLH